MTSHTIVALPSGVSGRVPDGTSVRSALRNLGVGIESLCAENATCGKCRILVEEGAFDEYGIRSSAESLSPPGPDEQDFLGSEAYPAAPPAQGSGRVRLACQSRVIGDVVVSVPEESRTDRRIVRKSAVARTIQIVPSIRKYLVELTPPSLSHPEADWDRLATGLATSMRLVGASDAGLPSAEELKIDYTCLQDLSAVVRAANWRVTVSVWEDREVVRVQPGLDDRLVGAAIDIGTTTLAVYLCDLLSGNVLAAESDLNPQVVFGADVMSRIHYCLEHADGLEELHHAVIHGINDLLEKAAAKAGIDAGDVLQLVVVGNTTMVHLFLNISPRALGGAPFVPGVSAGVELPARDLGLHTSASGKVTVLPGIASFVGPDTTAVLLAEAPHNQGENWLIIDIGTNAELVLGNKDGMMCASTPTGPAFEGAQIRHGMRASPGAIEHFRIDANSLEPHWKLVGAERWDEGGPKGLCGSAAVDIVAELLRHGIIDRTGRILAETPAGGRVRQTASGPEYVVVKGSPALGGREIAFTQQDIRQIQLAKAALSVAARSILDAKGLESADKLILAGVFGSYIDKANAMAIGMLPNMDLDKIFVVGNAAGDGARIALLNSTERGRAASLTKKITRHELPADPAFQGLFIGALEFPSGMKDGSL